MLGVRLEDWMWLHSISRVGRLESVLSETTVRVRLEEVVIVLREILLRRMSVVLSVVVVLMLFSLMMCSEVLSVSVSVV